ncbi:hypothetical protein PUNSTDRAFT_123627, partial [Punctularia strigosozonata HHB-11173 SS5]|uniref:uncharacterized protein n=1 Tax=Punctularia strigosozonata (strain HHB-11173) TaxID=741275 RepID=UPI0004417224
MLPPLGPIDEKSLLKPYVTGRKARLFELRELQLMRNGKPAGFDQTEFIPKNPGRPLGEVYYRGVVRITNPDDLTTEGLQFLQKKLRHAGHNRQAEALIKSEGLDVYVHGKKITVVLFRRKPVPDGILFTSSCEHRFDIKSFHEDTALLSRAWLRQQHLYYDMSVTIMMDKDSVEPDHGPAYFIDAYIRGAYPERSMVERLIVDSSHLDLLPRKRRELDYEEVAELFYQDIDFILSHNKMPGKSGKKLNIAAWQEFKRRGQRGDFSRFTEPVVIPKKKAVRRFVGHVRRKDEYDDWDSDYTIPSTSAESSSSDEEGARPGMPPDPELTEAIPAWILQEPRIGPNWSWGCPHPGCSYSIKLLALSEREAALLDPADLRFIKGRSWHTA